MTSSLRRKRPITAANQTATNHGDHLWSLDLLRHGRQLAAAGALGALATLSWLSGGPSSAGELQPGLQRAAPQAAQPNTVVAPGGLRWRTAQQAAQQAVATGRTPQPVANAGAHAEIDAFAEPIQQTGWIQRTGGEHAGDPDSQPAVNLQPIHPIADPYGDRVAQAPAPIRPLRPAQAAPAPPDAPLVVPRAPVDAEPMLVPPAGQPMNPSLAEPMPEPMPMRIVPSVPSRPEEVPLGDPMPMPRRPAPAFAAPPGRKNADCDKIYNGRNFCDEDGECRSAIKSLANKPLSAISLDISPRFDPTAADPAAAEAKMKERFAEMESRVWKDRQGQTVATGKLVDFDRGEVVIEQPNGQTTRIVARDLDNDSHAFFNAWWGLPHDCRLSDAEYREIAINEYRYWDHPLTMTWKASALCHKPLYFEETCLERYGHTTGPYSQPFVSCAHFFGNICFLPYKMGMDPPHECQYALGYYRPGSCAPWYIPAAPISPRGAAVEAAFILGTAYVIP